MTVDVDRFADIIARPERAELGAAVRDLRAFRGDDAAADFADTDDDMLDADTRSAAFFLGVDAAFDVTPDAAPTAEQFTARHELVDADTLAVIDYIAIAVNSYSRSQSMATKAKPAVAVAVVEMLRRRARLTATMRDGVTLDLVDPATLAALRRTDTDAGAIGAPDHTDTDPTEAA